MAISLFEKKNFCVNSQWWEEKETVWYIDWIAKKVRIKVNPERDIFEYVDGPYPGEQIFGHDAVVREISKAGKKLPANYAAIVAMIDIQPGNDWLEKYHNFLQNNAIVPSGFYSPDNHSLYNIHQHAYMRLDNGWYIEFYADKCEYFVLDSLYGFSVRCLQL